MWKAFKSFCLGRFKLYNKLTKSEFDIYFLYDTNVYTLIKGFAKQLTVSGIYHGGKKEEKKHNCYFIFNV